MKNKKHKVKIPQGYKVESTMTNAPPTSITINLKPIKKELPKTWVEYCRIAQHYSGFFNVTTTDSCYHSQMESLYRLLKLRDHYNDGWEPDWTDNCSKYAIWIDDNDQSRAITIHTSSVLAFKTEALRDEFLSNFQELIKTAKPLL